MSDSPEAVTSTGTNSPLMTQQGNEFSTLPSTNGLTTESLNLKFDRFDDSLKELENKINRQIANLKNDENPAISELKTKMVRIDEALPRLENLESSQEAIRVDLDMLQGQLTQSLERQALLSEVMTGFISGPHLQEAWDQFIAVRGKDPMSPGQERDIQQMEDRLQQLSRLLDHSVQAGLDPAAFETLVNDGKNQLGRLLEDISRFRSDLKNQLFGYITYINPVGSPSEIRYEMALALKKFTDNFDHPSRFFDDRLDNVVRKYLLPIIEKGEEKKTELSTGQETFFQNLVTAAGLEFIDPVHKQFNGEEMKISRYQEEESPNKVYLVESRGVKYKGKVLKKAVVVIGR